MAEHLEKSIIKQYIKDFCKGLISDDRQFDPVDDAILLCQMIDFAPAADVVEVKHGKWKSTGRKLMCSVCGHKVYIGTDDVAILTEEAALQRYCFHCGAKMEQILRIVDDGVKDVTTPELIKRYNHYFDNGYIDDDTEE